MARLLATDRSGVLQALERAGHNLREFQTCSGLTALRYFSTCWLAVLVLALAWSALGTGWQLLLLPLMAITQHALLNIVHEASHYSLLRDRSWGDRVANLFAALPIGHTVASYRLTHVDHHLYLRTPRDPASYVTRPGLTRGEIRRTLLFLLAGRLVWELLARSLAGRRFDPDAEADATNLKATDRRRLVAVAAFHLPALLLFWSLGMPGFWLAWLAVVMTLTPTLDALRTLVEHRVPPEDTLPFHTRSHHRNLLVSGLMAPFFQYHWEHHLFPGIPHDQLAALHQVLLDEGVTGARPVPGGFLGALVRLV